MYVSGHTKRGHAYKAQKELLGPSGYNSFLIPFCFLFGRRKVFRPPTFPEVPKGRFKSQVRAGKRCRDQGGAVRKQPAPGGSPTASAESSCRTKTPPGWRKVTGLSTDSRAPPCHKSPGLRPPPRPPHPAFTVSLNTIKEVRFSEHELPLPAWPHHQPFSACLASYDRTWCHAETLCVAEVSGEGRRGPPAGCLGLRTHGLTHVLREEGGRPGNPWRTQTWGHRQEPRGQGSLL